MTARITPEQAKINALLGLSNETFAKYSQEPAVEGNPGSFKAFLTLVDPLQRDINRQLGIADEVFLKYAERP